MMEYYDVDSSTISRIGYDPQESRLEIHFKKGNSYEYYDVPQHVFDEFLTSDSKGKYANANIYKTYRQQRIG